MIKVFITIDTEIWCDGWQNIDKKFLDSFKKYIYGPTAQGDYGLPLQLKILNDNNIKADFFTEPLFSLRFGNQPLVDIVELIKSHDQNIELHIHPEWIDEAINPIFRRPLTKTPFLRAFSIEEQTHLIKIGKELIINAGLSQVSAFRAGSYAANSDTLKAIANNDIFIDSSYNRASEAGVADIAIGTNLIQPAHFEKVTIYPITFFSDKSRKTFRNLQITACSSSELEFVLNHAFENNWDSVVIVSHSFELLTPDKLKPNKVVTNRFIKLCEFLDKNRDRFISCNMKNTPPPEFLKQPITPSSNRLRTFARMCEQKIGTL